MLAAVAMCIQFRSHLRAARFTLHTDHKVVGFAASLQRHRRHDVPMASCSATVPVLYCTPTWKRPRGMPMASHALRPHHVDSAPDLTAHRPSYYTTIRTNHSTLSRPVALRTLIWCRSSRGKIGLPGWTMICHNRPQSREIHLVFQPFSERTRYASHYIHGLLQTSFPHGRR